jgi:NADH-quinone oxidoreductase subunit I
MKSTAQTQRFGLQEVPVRVAPRPPKYGFFAAIPWALGSLGKGMKITLGYLLRPSTVVTQQYPENRDTLRMFERFRSRLTLPKDENGFHKCTACGLCQVACPNDSVKVIERKGEITGKREIDRLLWRLDSCTFCNACVQACPPKALAMSGEFESSVYDRRLLVYDLTPYAGPPATVLAKVEAADEQAKMMEARIPYGGPVPMNGTKMDGVPVLGDESQ